MKTTVFLAVSVIAFSLTAIATALPPPRRVCQTVVVTPYVPMKVIDGGWVAVGCHRARRIVRHALRTHDAQIARFTCGYDDVDVPAACESSGRSPSYISAVWGELST